jgi:hypothetical protein
LNLGGIVILRCPYMRIFIAVALVSLAVSAADGRLSNTGSISENGSVTAKNAAEDLKRSTEIREISPNMWSQEISANPEGEDISPNMGSEDIEPPETRPAPGFDMFLALLGFSSALIIMKIWQ